MNMQGDESQEVDVIAETDNYFVWRSEDENGDQVYHVELGGVSLHLVSEEWDELILLIKSAA
jgi:hypothetical protein